MASVTKWQDSYQANGATTILSTELNSLTTASRTVKGSAYDNGSNLNQYGKLELNVTFGVAPTSGGYVNIYALYAPDGTNYEDGDGSTAPSALSLVASIPVRATTSAQKLFSRVFLLEPAPVKFVLENQAGQSFPASGSTVKLYIDNDEAQ